MNVDAGRASPRRKLVVTALTDFRSGCGFTLVAPTISQRIRMLSGSAVILSFDSTLDVWYRGKLLLWLAASVARQIRNDQISNQRATGRVKLLAFGGKA